MQLETLRLCLRPPRMSDQMDFFDIFSDGPTCRADGGYPPFTVQDDAFAAQFASIVQDGENRLFIAEKSSGRVIGVMHLMETGVADEMEIGYVIHRDFRRRGYASEALEAVSSVLAKQGFTCLRAMVYAFNQPSRLMLEKLGFTLEGTVDGSAPEWNEVIYTRRLDA